MEPQPPTQRSVAEIFDRKVSAARHIERNWEYMTSKQLSDFALLEQAGPDGRDILNVGCFFPLDEIRYAHRVNSWTATDFGETTIRIAEESARKHLAPDIFGRLRFMPADGRALPFPEESFDIAVSFSTIDHIVAPEDRQRFLNELARVVRRGGHVVVTAPNRWSRGYAKRAGSADDNEAPDFFEHCFSPMELKRMLLRAGLEPIKFTSTSEIPILAPRAIFPSLRLRPVVGPYSRIAKFFGVRMGFLAVKN
jgi:SAM-dependent methyltransferase